MDDIKHYVAEELELRTQPKALQTGDIGDMEAAVVGGSVISCVKDVTPQQRADVLDSTLIAQLGASGKYDRFGETKEWYQEYVEILGHVGWVVSQLTFNEVQATGDNFKMDVAALQAIRNIAMTSGLGVLESSLRVLGALEPEDNALTLFDSKATLTNSGNFQLGSAEVGDDGALTVSLGAFHFEVENRRQRFLFFEWNSQEVDFWAAVQVMTLNERFYRDVRDDVAKRLRAYKDDYIWKLEPN